MTETWYEGAAGLEYRFTAGNGSNRVIKSRTIDSRDKDRYDAIEGAQGTGCVDQWFYSTDSFSRITNYQPASTNYHNPIVTEAGNLVQTVGDNPEWTKDVKATWGKTTANIIKATSTATTEGGGDGMGTIVDTSLSGGTDADLSSDGLTFDKIGVKLHSYLIKDAHSLSSDGAYSGDNTSTTTTRNIIVKTAASPNLKAYYAGTDEEYGGEWLSQYKPAKAEEGPDADHFKKVDLKASGSSIAGTYDTVIWDGKASNAASATEKARGENTNQASFTFGDETSSDGRTFFANLQEVNKGTIAKTAGLTALSGNSDEKTVKIDSTPPTASVSVNDDWHDGLSFEDSSRDSLSGIDEVYVALLAPGSEAPSIGAASWQKLGSSGKVDYTPGAKYDIYAYAVDNATNKSAVTLLESNRETIRRHYEVSYESNGGSVVAPERVYEGEKATEPADPTKTDYHFVGWYEDAGLENAFDFDTEIMQDTKLYAKWVDDKNHNGVDDNTEFRTITYTDGVDGEDVFTDVVYSNALDNLPTPAFDPADPDKEPTRRYFVFDGWNPQVAGVVNGNATYTAKWEVDNNEDGVPDNEHPYTVTFDSDGKDWVNGPAPQTGILYGGKVTRPSPDPGATNYIFAGWYKENTFNNIWNFDSDVVHHNLTIYAKWLDDFNSSGVDDNDEYVTVKYEDGVDEEVLFDAQIYEKQLPGNAPPEFRGVPSREFYVFGGWNPEVPDVIPEVPKDTVITYKATWKADRNDNGIADSDEEFEYYYSKGDGSTWTKGSGKTQEFTVNRSLFDDTTFDHFTGIEIDGAAVDPTKYEAKEGSVELALAASYMESLSVGKHTIKALFDDGEATASFTVNEKSKEDNGQSDNSKENTEGSTDNDKGNNTDTSKDKGDKDNGDKDNSTIDGNDNRSARTGDETNLMLWIILACISLLGIFAGCIYRKVNE